MRRTSILPAREAAATTRVHGMQEMRGVVPPSPATSKYRMLATSLLVLLDSVFALVIGFEFEGSIRMLKSPSCFWHSCAVTIHDFVVDVDGNKAIQMPCYLALARIFLVYLGFGKN